MILGCDGGFYVTYDRMDHWDHLNHQAIGQFYDVALDTRRFYNVYGGLQDNGTWGGPSRTRSRTGPVNEDWLNVGGGDGFGCQVDPDDPDLVYFTSQNGTIGRRNLRTGAVDFFRPRPPDRDTRYRFNWNTPFLLSHHNPKIYYVAGNFVFRSLDKGNQLAPISREISHTDKGSATALAESPRDPNVLYVGTDDGALWVTKDGGREWTEIGKNVGLPKPLHVASIEASRFKPGRVYGAFDGHRSNLDDPFAYASEDFGVTWTSLKAGLPRGSTRCLREDLTNADILYLGTEFSAFVSIDRGQSWNSLNTNLPTVAVHELAQHPSTGELVAATHGRSLWIADVSPLRQLTPEILKSSAHLFQPLDVQRWHSEPARGRTNRRFEGQNPPNGLPIAYHLAQKAGKISLKIFDIEGQAIRTLNAPTNPGLRRVVWDLTRINRRPPESAHSGGREGERESEEGESSSAEPGRRPERREGAFGRPQAVAPGTYRIVLTVDGQEFSRVVRIEPDPDASNSVIAAESTTDDEDSEHELREVRGMIDID